MNEYIEIKKTDLDNGFYDYRVTNHFLHKETFLEISIKAKSDDKMFSILSKMKDDLFKKGFKIVSDEITFLF